MSCFLSIKDQQNRNFICAVSCLSVPVEINILTTLSFAVSKIAGGTLYFRESALTCRCENTQLSFYDTS